MVLFGGFSYFSIFLRIRTFSDDSIPGLVVLVLSFVLLIELGFGVFTVGRGFSV